MATIDGTNDPDYLIGTDEAETINGLNAADFIDGLGGNDTINGGRGDDTIIGGSGDDVLTGGNGPDDFYYSFTVSSGVSLGPQSYASYLAELGLTSLTSQSDFSTTYTAWLNYLVFGGDDGWQGLAQQFGWVGDIQIGLNQNDSSGSQPHISVDGVAQDLSAVFGEAQNFSWTKGKATQERTYWDIDESYWGGELALASSDGHDTITDFVSGQDQLYFRVGNLGELNVDDAEDRLILQEAFEVTSGDYNGDGIADTRIATDDMSMSITLLGYTGNVWGDVVFVPG